MTFPIYGKITNVPNHQPVIVYTSLYHRFVNQNLEIVNFEENYIITFMALSENDGEETHSLVNHRPYNDEMAASGEFLTDSTEDLGA